MEAAVTLHPILARWDQDTDGGTRFNVPKVWTACHTNVEEILWTQVMCELLQQFCPSSFYIGDVLWWRWSERQRLLGWQWGKGMFVVSSHGKKMEERQQWAREEEERTMRCEVEGEGCTIEGEGGVGWGWRASCFTLLG
jgi:hypothetical protein